MPELDRSWRQCLVGEPPAWASAPAVSMKRWMASLACHTLAVSQKPGGRAGELADRDRGVMRCHTLA